MKKVSALKKEKTELLGKMKQLWEKRDKTPWTDDESANYEAAEKRVSDLSDEIEKRMVFESQMVSEVENQKDTKEHIKNRQELNMYHIIQGEVARQKGVNFRSMDPGRVNEVLSEHKRSIPSGVLRDGYQSVPDSVFELPEIPKKRASITSADANAGNLVSEIVKPELYAEGLYSKTWVGEAGCPVLTGLQGDVKIPQLGTKPSGAFVAEDADFSDGSMDFNSVNLTPLQAGGIQIFSLQSFLRSQNQSVMQFVQQELLNFIRSVVERAFVRDDGSANKPKGLYSIIGSTAQNKIEIATNGANIDYAHCLETEGKITSTDQHGELTWLISDKVRLSAQQKLKFAVNGASQLFQNGMLADRKTLISNHISDSITQGTSANNTSTIIIFQPQSFVVGRWTGGLQVQVNTLAEAYFKKGQTGVRVLDVCNCVSRRDGDFAGLAGITH